MKQIFTLLLLIPTLLFSQWRKVPEKKDNAIRVHNVTFHDAVRKLIDMGYRMDKIDSNYRTIQVSMDAYQTMFIRFDTTNAMVITGDIYFHTSMIDTHAPVLYWKSAFNRARWDMMMKYAGLFQDLEYAKL